MGDKENRFALVLQLFPLLIKKDTSSLTKSGCGFINDEDFRILVETLSDFNQFTLLPIISSGNPSWIDIIDTDIGESKFCMLAKFLSINE